MNETLSGLRVFAQAFMPVIFAGISVFAGMLMIFKGVLQLSRMGDERAAQSSGSSWNTVAGNLLIGALLLQFSSTMNDVSVLMFGTPIQDSRNVMAYVNLPSGGGSGFSFWRTAMETALLWVVFLGWISALRGFFKWNQAASGQQGGNGDPFWQGLWHILGGACAINISGFVGSFFGK